MTLTRTPHLDRRAPAVGGFPTLARLLLGIAALLAAAAPARAQSLTIDNVTALEGDSGTSPFTFTVTLVPSSAQTVTVSYATQNNGAQAPGDYAATSGVLTFLPGETAKPVTVDVQGDTTWEGIETFFVNLSSPVNATIADGLGVGSITNDDVQVSIGDATVLEGDGGTVALTFNVTLSAPKNILTLTVDFATQNNGALAPVDYTAASGTVTFLPGETAKTVTVYANGDTVYEGQENFMILLTNPVNCSLGDPLGYGFIQNDDVQVSISDASAVEGDAGTVPLSFNVTLSAPKDNLTLTVDFATQNNGASAPVDYTAAAGTVTFLPGETVKTVTVHANGDTVYEGQENFMVHLTNASNCSLGDPLGYGFIQNDDVQVSISDASAVEGDAGAVPLTFNVTLSAPKNNLTLTVDFATQNNGALAPADYAAAAGTVTFLPGETAKTVTVYANGDTAWEGVENFIVMLTNAVNCSLGDPQGYGFIQNDDVTVSVGDVTLVEGNGGTTAFDFNVTLSGPKNNLTVEVSFATSNNGAQAPADYEAASGVVTFPPGVTAQVVTVQVVGDLALESTENFMLTLSNPVNCSLGDYLGYGFIHNDDVQGAIAIEDLSLPEGSSGQTPFGFTVSLSPPSATTVSVQFATAGGTAVAGQDYVSGSGTLTFAPGETEKTLTVSVLGDALEECEESFVVNLANAVGAPIADSQAIGTIEDDENPACPDLDGDCRRDAACGGSDCDDANPDSYPGAAEINDGADNQCPNDQGYGCADEIAGISGFLDPGDPTKFAWPAQQWAVEYEVARATSRDFASGCMLSPSSVETFILDEDVPPSKGTFYYLVRSLSPNVGSWGLRSGGSERTVACAP